MEANRIMLSLLEKIRKINHAIQQSVSYQVDFGDMAQILSEVIECSIYVLSRQGKLLGTAIYSGIETSVMEDEVLEQGSISPEFNQELLRIDTTDVNQKAKEQTESDPQANNPFIDKIITVVPLAGGGERLGTLILAKQDSNFSNDDLVLAEYAATVVGMEILRGRSDRIDSEVRKKAACQIAIGTLSFSEQEAIEHIFDELNGDDGLLIASKIADSVGITRSVIVNALRKLESAGVIESRSLGMKGTHIRVLNEYFLDELAKHRTR